MWTSQRRIPNVHDQASEACPGLHCARKGVANLQHCLVPVRSLAQGPSATQRQQASQDFAASQPPTLRISQDTTPSPLPRTCALAAPLPFGSTLAERCSKIPLPEGHQGDDSQQGCCQQVGASNGSNFQALVEARLQSQKSQCGDAGWPTLCV